MSISIFERSILSLGSRISCEDCPSVRRLRKPDLACSRARRRRVKGGKGTFWKVPVDGGESVLLTVPRGLNGTPILSPNGRQIAASYWDEQLDPPGGVAIFSSEGGPPTRRLTIHFDYEAIAYMLGWALDGRALLSIDDNRANIWSRPFDGSKRTRLTDFQGDELFNFAYSRDGNWLAVARGRVTKDSRDDHRVKLASSIN